MNTRTPIFIAPHAALRLQRGLWLCPREALPQMSARSEWVRGLLVLDLDDCAGPVEWERWLLGLSATVVTESDQVPVTARLCVPPMLVPTPLLREGLWAIEFAFDLAALPGVTLNGEPFYLHLSCRFLISPVQHRSPSAPSRYPEAPSLLSSDLERLVVGYTLARAERPEEATVFFTRALTSEETRSEICRPHLFNAACAASLGADATAETRRRDELLALSVRCLEGDLQASESMLLRVWHGLAEAPEPETRDCLRRRRDALVAHLDARGSDPDLLPLRLSSAWSVHGREP